VVQVIDSAGSAMSRWWRQEEQHCTRVPVKLLHILLGTSEPLNNSVSVARVWRYRNLIIWLLLQGVDDVQIGRLLTYLL